MDDLNPLGQTKKESTLQALIGQAPYLVGCLSCFQLYPLMVEKVNIFIDDLFGLLKGGGRELAERFFFEMPEEVFHGGIVPTVRPS